MSTYRTKPETVTAFPLTSRGVKELLTLRHVTIGRADRTDTEHFRLNAAWGDVLILEYGTDPARRHGTYGVLVQTREGTQTGAHGDFVVTRAATDGLDRPSRFVVDSATFEREYEPTS